MNIDRKKIAQDKHKIGYNCCQSVACAFVDCYDIDEATLLKISEGFGGGMGIQSVCGAATAMVILAGLENADGNTEGPKTKKETSAVVKELLHKFEEKNTTLICRELKGIDTKVVLRSCMGCMEDAVEIYEDYLNSLK